MDVLASGGALAGQSSADIGGDTRDAPRTDPPTASGLGCSNFIDIRVLYPGTTSLFG